MPRLTLPKWSYGAEERQPLVFIQTPRHFLKDSVRGLPVSSHFQARTFGRAASFPAKTSSADDTILLQARYRLAKFMLRALNGISCAPSVFVPLGNRNLAKDWSTETVNLSVLQDMSGIPLPCHEP